MFQRDAFQIFLETHSIFNTNILSIWKYSRKNNKKVIVKQQNGMFIIHPNPYMNAYNLSPMGPSDNGPKLPYALFPWTAWESSKTN